jgi:hypothetical protein
LYRPQCHGAESAYSHQDIASTWVVPVLDEIAAFELELDADSLPLAGRKLTFGFTVREADLNCLH